MTKSNVELHRGDVLAVLKRLPAASVHCVVTSPPYWGLRDYGVRGQLGLEPTPEAYVERMVEIFREVRRVLRDDGTCWVNMGDSYASGEIGRHDALQSIGACVGKTGISLPGLARSQQTRRQAKLRTGLKPKDLVGIPWRLAFALQADGWYLRSDIIWHKPNPMPESVRDRPTKSHEYLFLLSKSERYYFDADAVREGATPQKRTGGPDHFCPKEKALRSTGMRHKGATAPLNGPTGCHRNIRSVWTIPTRPYKGAHFATFPPKLVIPCVKAGTSERGCCPECGKPWKRVTKAHRNGRDWNANNRAGGSRLAIGQNASDQMPRDYQPPTTIGWVSTCNHHRTAVPCVVLDPFAGSGTTGAVCVELGRDFIGIDLNPEYLTLARRRIADAQAIAECPSKPKPRPAKPSTTRSARSG